MPEGTRLGSSTVPVYGMQALAVSVDPPNQGAGGFFSMNVNIPGIRSGDVVKLFPPDTLENTLRLVGQEITADDTLTLRLEATAAVDGAARTWRGFWLDLTPTGG